ncbi:MAG: hypothetical protein MJ180_03220 [Candidatus Gastranaerophilales bacterium]|nr:hypothetical protein [Candidatus Gastranaerophilales bacterium]
MKKIIKCLFVFAVVLFINSAFASDSDLYKLYCPAQPYDISNGFSKGVQSVTGLNLIARKIAEGEIKKEISKFATGKIKVKVKTFSATDTKNGRFRSFNIKGENLKIYSIPISEFTAQTACNFIYLDLEKNPVELKEPMTIDFSAKFTENDLNNILKTPTYHKYLIKIKHNSSELKFVELKKPRISLKNNKFNFALDVNAPLIGTFIFKIQSDLRIKDNKINIANMFVGSNSKTIDLSSAKYFMNVFNPLWFAQLILQQHNCKLLLKNVKIENGNIIILGSVFLKKS